MSIKNKSIRTKIPPCISSSSMQLLAILIIILWLWDFLFFLVKVFFLLTHFKGLRVSRAASVDNVKPLKPLVRLNCISATQIQTDWLVFFSTFWKVTFNAEVAQRRPVHPQTSLLHDTPLSSGTNHSAPPWAWSHEPLPVFPAPLPQCVSIVTLAEVQTAGRALWRALHTHHMKDFHQATAASRRHTNGILLLKGGTCFHWAHDRQHISGWRRPGQHFFYSFIFAVVRGTPNRPVMSDTFCWHGELLFACLVFLFVCLFFSLMKKI